MVIAYHLIWTSYGYWLPNDLRGTSSHLIRNDVLKELGDLHFGRKKIQPSRSELRQFFDESRPLLKHPVREFDDDDIQIIGDAFANVMKLEKYTCYAMAVMPDHVHAVIRKHRDQAEQMIAKLQRESHLRLRDAGRFDMDHPIWGGPGWKVFLDSPDDVWRTIPYVEQNPMKMGRPKQNWAFVTQYGNWPNHKRQ